MATVTFDKLNKFIQLGVADVEATIQEMMDAIRTYEEDLNNMDFVPLASATGKDSIGGGDFTSITMVLEDGWKVRGDDTFAVATTIRVVAGNLIDGLGASPFEPVTNVSYDRAFSTAPGLANVPDVIGTGDRSLDV